MPAHDAAFPGDDQAQVINTLRRAVGNLYPFPQPGYGSSSPPIALATGHHELQHHASRFRRDSRLVYDFFEGLVSSFAFSILILTSARLSSGQKQAQIAEERLLRRMNTFRGADEPDTAAPMSANARVSQIQLSDKSQTINMLSIQPTTPATTSGTSTTVILHGYGAGLGFFSPNLDTLSTWVSKRGQPVYLLDWLGMGRSSRPTFKVTAKHANTHQRVTQAEDFFLDALEEWRGKMNIDKMNLVGHSLGAYLVTAYALKYPQHVERLVLLSPAGVNAGPDSTLPDDELQRSRSNPGPEDVRSQVKDATPSDVAALRKEQIDRGGAKPEKQKEKESFGRRLVSDQDFSYLVIMG